MARPVAHSGFTSRSETPSGQSFDASVVHHYRRGDRYNDFDSERTPSPEDAQDMRRSRAPSPRARASAARDYSHGAGGSARPYTPSAAQLIPSSKPARSRSTPRAGMQKLGLGGYLAVERPALGRSPSSNRSELLGMIMAEEDRQLRSYRDANDALADRLDQEIRRADDAERRADRAENKLRDSQSRGLSYSTAKQQAEVEVLRLQEEVKRYRMQLASAAKELQRAQAEIDILDQQRVDAEQSAVNARETARQYRTALEAQRAREEGLLEGRRLGIEESVRNYLAESGQQQLLLEAPRPPVAPPQAPRHVPDPREAYERGRAHGYDEGREEGVQAEREQAFDAFGRFMADHEEELAPLAREQKSVVRPPRPRLYTSRPMTSNSSLGYAHDGASPSYPAESSVAARPPRPYGSRAATRGTASDTFSFADPETANRTVNGMFSRLLATVPGMDDDALPSPVTTRDRERPILRIPTSMARRSTTDTAPEDSVSSRRDDVHGTSLN